jgi:8-oxo-dGTP pyrophosphatase MutT (NUDIX family)
MDNYCNNCGKSGHSFHQCKIPILSIGIVAFRKNPEVRFDSEFKYEYLMICRKNSLGYMDFMRGKYSLTDPDYLKNMFKQMTVAEKTGLMNGPFDKLWNELWVDEMYNSRYKSEKSIANEKYNSLVRGVSSNTRVDNVYRLSDLINESICSVNEWTEPEWGFPKGRRNSHEKNYDCACREFCEETGYKKSMLNNIQNIVPYEEIFIGSNYKSYKHKYYLMYMKYEDTQNTSTFQKSEVSKMEWKSFHECMECIRPYNLEKKRIIEKINASMRRMKIFGDCGL